MLLQHVSAQCSTGDGGGCWDSLQHLLLVQVEMAQGTIGHLSSGSSTTCHPTKSHPYTACGDQALSQPATGRWLMRLATSKQHKGGSEAGSTTSRRGSHAAARDGIVWCCPAALCQFHALPTLLHARSRSRLYHNALASILINPVTLRVSSRTLRLTVHVSLNWLEPSTALGLPAPRGERCEPLAGLFKAQRSKISPGCWCSASAAPPPSPPTRVLASSSSHAHRPLLACRCRLADFEQK